MTESFKSINISCADGYPLSARFYPSPTQNQDPVLICSATGIVKSFYHAFATWLNKQGHPVLTFDFRGIGDSLYGKLKDSTATIQDWGQLDIPAAIDTLIKLTNQDEIILLGHSAGGQLLGITPNFRKVKKIVAIAGSTGHVKDLKGRTKLMAPIMFNVIFPISRLVKGYGATKMLGMGENLPKNVAKQWAQFCNKPGYVYNAVGKTIFEDYHDQISIPFTAIHATDDEIATEANVNGLLQLYPNAKTKRICLIPSDYEHSSIGHMLMFKKSHQNLWPLIAEQFTP